MASRMSEGLRGSPMGQHTVGITSGSFENAAPEELAKRRIVKARRNGMSSAAAAFDTANVRPSLEMGFKRDTDKKLKRANATMEPDDEDDSGGPPGVPQWPSAAKPVPIAEQAHPAGSACEGNSIISVHMSVAQEKAHTTSGMWTFSSSGRNKINLSLAGQGTVSDVEMARRAQNLRQVMKHCYPYAQIYGVASPPLKMTVDCAGRGFGDNGMKELCNALVAIRHPKLLVCLRLFNLRITDVSIPDIANVLKVYEGGVTELHLSHNAITNQGVRQLCSKGGMIQHYPMRNARSGLYKPLLLRLEHCKVNGKQLNLEKWMYTPETTPLQWGPDCPPLQIPHLDLPVPQPDALLTRPRDSKLRQQMPTDVPLRTADHATLANQHAQDYTHRRVVDALLKIVRQAPDGQISGASLCAALYKEYAVAKDVIVQEYQGLKNFLASSMLKDEVEYVSDQAGGKVAARWKTSSVATSSVAKPKKGETQYPVRSGQKTCSHYLKTGKCACGSSCQFDHPRNETNVAAGGERTKDLNPKLGAKNAVSDLDMPANRYEALPQIVLPSESAAAIRSEEGANATKEASVVAETLKALRHEVLLPAGAAVRLIPARRKAEDDKKREMEKAEDEKKRETETRERERRREMEQKRKQQEKMEKENKRKEEENILKESRRQQMYCFRCNDRKTGVLSDMFVHVDILWEDFAAQLDRHFQRPVYILYRRDGDGPVGDNQMQMIPGGQQEYRAVQSKDDFEELCAHLDDKQRHDLLPHFEVEVRELEELQEKKRKELQQEKDNIAKQAADAILLCLQSGKLLEAKKTLCREIEHARLNIAVSQRIGQGFIKHKIHNVELNIRKVLITQGANNSEIIRIIAAFIPCIEESCVIEALKYCAQQKDYWPLLKPLINRLPNMKISDLPVLKAIENEDASRCPLEQELLSGPLNLLLQAGACPNTDRGPWGVTPLHVAISKGGWICDRFVEMLLRAKADCNIADIQKMSTPLHEACRIEDAEQSLRIVELMIQHDENIDIEIKNKQKKTALEISRHESVKMILKRQSQRNEGPKSKKKPAQLPTSGKTSDCTGTSPSKPFPVSVNSLSVARSNASQSWEKSQEKKTEDVKPTLTINQRLEALLSSVRVAVPGIVGTESAVKHKKMEVVNFKPVDVASSIGQSVGKETDTSAVDVSQISLTSVLPIVMSEPAGQQNQMETMEPEQSVPFVVTQEDQISATIFSSEAAWDLRFTREFKEQIFSLHRQPLLLQALVRNLGRLAAGEQSRTLCKQLKGVPKSLRIYESPVKTFNDGPRFLWQYSVDYSPRIRGFTDCIRLWRLCLQHDDVPKGIEWIVESHKRGRLSIMKKGLISSTKGSTLQPDRRRIPRTYAVCDGVNMEALAHQDGIKFELLTGDEDESAQDIENEDQEGHILFTPPAVSNADSYNVLKFYQLSDEVLQTLRSFCPHDPQQVPELSNVSLVPEFPFIPDDREDMLINSNLINEGTSRSSILLVGRSGTGKTSIAVGRMWALYKHCHSDSYHGGDYNQIFVTANRVLRDQVRKSFQGMKNGFKCGQQAVSSEYPPTFSHVPTEMFPLFLTQSEFLKMLDGTLAEPFWPRNEDGSLKNNMISTFHEEDGMLERLPDEDFDDLSDSDDGNDELEDKQHTQTGNDKGRLEINFEVFLTQIWPKLSNTLTKQTSKNVSPGSLFQEIHSYIKGSADSLRSSNGRLTRLQYNNLGAKMAPNFRKAFMDDLPSDRSDSRDFVYDLYEQYEREKSLLNAYDVSDVVFHIWGQLQKSAPQQRTPIHSIYIDETQDFTQGELSVFLRIAEDKNDMFFSGDTAQCIATGVGFRFEDLTTLFKYERDRQDLIYKLQSLPEGLAVKIPIVKTLTVNYRTHNGILAAAAGIVDLMEHFFPATIDNLPREKGFFAGPKPMLLSETAVDDAAVMIVGADRKHSQIEFGAAQVLLVRTQDAKDTLPTFFDGCLAMTILESKGLEFDDVFLWNFLTDSKAKQEWRLVLKYLVEKDASELDRLEAMRASHKDKCIAGMLRDLEFNEQAHQVLSSELKHLYTAITRARVRVVIYDEDAANRAPLFYYLERRGLCDSVSVLGHTSAQGLTVESSPEDWRTQGNNLLQRQMFDLAAKCFRKSGDTSLENEAAAQHLFYKEAPKLVEKRVHWSKLVELYLETAERFMAAGVSQLSVAKCAHLAGRACAQKDGDRKLSQSFFDLAGRAYTLCARADNASDDVLKKAIGCLRKAESSSCIDCAVDLLVFRGKYLHSLKLLREEHRYEDALSLLEKHQAHPSLDLPPQHDLHKAVLMQAAAGHHALSAQNLKQSEDNRASSYARFLKIVSQMSAEDEEHCLLTHGYKDELIHRLVARNSFSKAGQLLSREGKRIEACKILCETNPNPGKKDLEHGIELLLAHAVQKECCEGERLKTVMKAQELQSRLDSSVSTAKTGEEASGLDLFMARIESDPKQKVDRLKRLMVKTTVSHDLSMDFPLVRVLAGCELFCIQTHQTVNLRSLCPDDAKPPEWFKESVHLLGDIDTIMAKLTDKDTNKETENRFEIFFGIRRPFGMCCISPARKQIMDWMIESDTFLAQPSPVMNRDGDFVIESSVLKSALLQYLAALRKKLLFKTSFLLHGWRQSFRLSAHHTRENKPKREHAQCLLLLIWVITANRKSKGDGKGDRRQDLEVDLHTFLHGSEFAPGSLVQVQGIAKKKTGSGPRSGDLATVLQVCPDRDIKVQLSAGGKEITLKPQNLAIFSPSEIFSDTSLVDTCSKLEDFLVHSTWHLEKTRLDGLLPSYIQQSERKCVLQTLRDHVWLLFPIWKKKQSANSLSRMLLVLESIGYSKEFDNLLRAVDHHFKQIKLAEHPFSNLLQSKRLGAGHYAKDNNIQPNQELAAHRVMMYLQAHRAEPPVDCIRSTLRAIAISLLDLSRQHIRSSVDIVNLGSSTSTALLPDSIARDLDRLPSANNSSSGHETLILGLEFVSASLEDSRFREYALTAKASAALFQMVSAISINYIVSHAPAFPSPDVLRWSLISEEAWGKIGALMDNILFTLEYDKKSKAQLLQLPLCSFSAPDPREFFNLLKSENNPLAFVKRISAGYVHDKGTSFTAIDVATWYEAGLKVLRSAQPPSSHPIEDSAGKAQEVNMDPLNPNAEPFIPTHMETLQDIERLDELADLEAQKDRAALLTIAAFFQRAMVHQEKRSKQVMMDALDPQEASFEPQQQQLDPFQRLALYRDCHEVKIDSSDQKSRGMWRGCTLLFNERSLAGPAEYDQVKTRMKSFQQHYEAHIAPLLIHTDLVMAKIHQLDISFNFSAAHPWQHDLKQRLANHDFHFQRGVQTFFDHLHIIEKSLWRDEMCLSSLNNFFFGQSGLKAWLEQSILTIQKFELQEYTFAVEQQQQHDRNRLLPASSFILPFRPQHHQHIQQYNVGQPSQHQMPLPTQFSRQFPMVCQTQQPQLEVQYNHVQGQQHLQGSLSQFERTTQALALQSVNSPQNCFGSPNHDQKVFDNGGIGIEEDLDDWNDETEHIPTVPQRGGRGVRRHGGPHNTQNNGKGGRCRRRGKAQKEGPNAPDLMQAASSR